MPLFNIEKPLLSSLFCVEVDLLPYKVSHHPSVESNK